MPKQNCQIFEIWKFLRGLDKTQTAEEKEYSGQNPSVCVLQEQG